MDRAGKRWSEQELLACVRAYADLWKAQQAGRPDDSAATLKALAGGELAGRAAGSPRMRFGNLSHVMDSEGQAFVQGFVPLRGISETERRRLAAMLRAEGVL